MAFRTKLWCGKLPIFSFFESKKEKNRGKANQEPSGDIMSGSVICHFAEKENQGKRGLKGESPFRKKQCLHVHAPDYILHP